MSRARHKMRAHGGKATVYAGEGSNVMKEAEEKKHGGKVHHGEGEHSKHRADKRARGGKVARAMGGHVEAEEKKHGGRAKHHHMGRARGGGVGANLKPLSTAAKVKHVTSGETPEEGMPSG